MARTKQVASRYGKKKPKFVIGKCTSGDNDDTKERKKRRFRPGTVALREIKKFQSGVNPLIPRAPFRRLVRQIGSTFKTDIRFGAEVFDAIQSMAEDHLVKRMKAANTAAIHAKRVGITKRDMEFAIQQAANRDD